MSLFEVLVSAALLFTCITIAVMAFTAGSRNFTKSREIVERQEECRRIMDMITTELREAEPTNVNVSASSVTFVKFHNPSGKFQLVIWRYSPDTRKAVREYAEPPGSSIKSTSFGERITDLSFVDTTRGASFHKIRISIKAAAAKETPSAPERGIVDIASEVYLRARQAVRVNVVFTRTPTPTP
jgi:hypothetical protein